MSSCGSLGMLRRFQFQKASMRDPLTTSGSMRFSSISSGFFGKFRQVNYINTHVEVKNDILEVNRTAYVGLKSIPSEIKAPLPEIETETEVNNTKAINEIDVTAECDDQSNNQKIEEEVDSNDNEVNHYSYLQPVEKYDLGSMPDGRKHIFERFRGNIFLHFPDGTRLIHHFFVDSQTISWNQNTILFLLLFLEEINGARHPKVSVETFIEASKKYGIKTANWQNSTKKHFQVEWIKNTPLISYSKELLDSGALNSELEERFNKIIDQVTSSCETLSNTLQAMKEDSVEIISQNQLLFALGALSLNEELAMKDLYEILEKNGISKANLYASLSSKSLIPLLIFNETRSSLSLSKSTILFETFQKHKDIIIKTATKIKKKQRISTKEKQEPLKPLEKNEALISLPSTEHVDENISRTFTANGYVSLLGEKDPKIFFHLPNSLLSDNMETRKTIIALALKLLSQYGVTSLTFNRVGEILSDNRLSRINLPRDLLKKPEFKCSPEKKCVSLVDLHSMDKQLSEISKYKVKEEDITEKMKQILPLIEEIRGKNQKDVIFRADLHKKCKEKKIAVNLPRDFSRLFGFATTEKIYLAPHPFNQAIAQLSHKKKQA